MLFFHLPNSSEYENRHIFTEEWNISLNAKTYLGITDDPDYLFMTTVYSSSNGFF